MPTWLLLGLIVLWAAVQYGLTVWALRDLLRREPPPGASKLPWAFVILTLPVVGAIAYATHGPGRLPFRLPERLDRSLRGLLASRRRAGRRPSDRAR